VLSQDGPSSVHRHGDSGFAFVAEDNIAALFIMMMLNQLARASVRPAQTQRRTFLNWMTNYPDRVSCVEAVVGVERKKTYRMKIPDS
jgi:hypothetical protein